MDKCHQAWLAQFPVPKILLDMSRPGKNIRVLAREKKYVLCLENSAHSSATYFSRNRKKGLLFIDDDSREYLFH